MKPALWYWAPATSFELIKLTRHSQAQTRALNIIPLLLPHTPTLAEIDARKSPFLAQRLNESRIRVNVFRFVLATPTLDSEAFEFLWCDFVKRDPFDSGSFP